MFFSCSISLVEAQSPQSEILGDFIFEDAKVFSDGLAAVKYEGKYGFINDKGEMIVPFIYDAANGYCNNYGSVKKGNWWKFVDKTGKLFGDDSYAGCGDFREGLASVLSGGKYGYIDSSGKLVIEAKFFRYDFDFPNMHFFENGYSVEINKDNYYGLIDKTGKIVISFDNKYEKLGSYQEDLLYAKKNGKYGFINIKGEVVIPFVYEKAGSFHEGLAKVQSNESHKYGFINKHGNVVVPMKYDDVIDGFHNGIACVKFNGKYGWINNQGIEIIPAKFDDAFGCLGTDGYIGTKLNGKWGLIDKTGKATTPFIYDWVNSYPLTTFDEGTIQYASVQQAKKWGLIDVSGKTILPIKYEELYYSYSSHYSTVKLNGKYGFVDNLGKPLKIVMNSDSYYKMGIGFLNNIEDYYNFDSNNFNLALKWLKKAPNGYNAGQLYSIGNKIEQILLKLEDETKQLELLKEALFFYEKAAVKGNLPSCLKLGNCYYHGLVYQKNYVEATKWLGKLADMKGPDQNGNCFLLMGHCYLEGGYGLTMDENKAFQYYKEGAKYKNNECERALAVCYLYGTGCTKNPTLACQYADKLYSINKQNYAELYSDCHNALAYDFARKSDYNNALSNIDKAIASPNGPHKVANLYDSKGEIYLMMGKEAEAIKMWEKVMELDKENLDFYKNGSELYKQLKA